MSQEQSITWVDYTDMLNWNGHFTGTQRVTYEIAKRLQSEKLNIQFFAYDEKSHIFFEVSFLEIEKNMLDSQERQNSSVSNPTGISLKSQIRSRTLHFYHNQLPYNIKKRITPERKLFLKSTYRKTRSLSKKFVGRNSGLNFPSNYPKESITFKKQDLVIILGKPWDTMSFIDELRIQKINNNFKLIHLVYDMIPVFLPHVFGKPLPENYTSYMFEAISLSDQMIAISESTKKDILKFCKEENLPAPPVEVIRLGDNFIHSNKSDSAIDGVIPNDFILCVGTIEVRKNHILLYTAYKEALSKEIKMPKLIIVGSLGWYVNDLIYQLNNDPDLKNLVKVVHGIDDSQLAWLYKNCKFTIYPSVYEGWGLPIAESLAYGKVCIASNSSSMPEVAGDLIDYFSPYSSSDCAELIEKYLDPGTLKTKELQIKNTYKSYGWNQTFTQFKKITKL